MRPAPTPFKTLFRRFLPWISTGAVVAYLIWATSQNGAWEANPTDLIPSHTGWLIALVLAMPVNWLLESWKWHRLLQRTTAFSRSFREVLIGASWAFITPNRTGDVVARVALLPKDNRAQGTRAFMTGAFAQMWITGCAGTSAWWAIQSTEPDRLALFSEWSPAIGTLLVAVTISTLMVYMLWRWPTAWNRFSVASEVLQSAPVSLALRLEILVLSALRFVVFTVQFFAALTAWGIALSGMQALYIPLVYLGNMIIPSAALSEMGTREALTLALFQPDPSQWWAAVTAVFAVWLINLGVPALAGATLSVRQQNTAR